MFSSAEVSLQLNNPNATGVYANGDTISGKVILRLQKPTEVKRITIRYWVYATTRVAERKNNGGNGTRTVYHMEYETFQNLEMVLFSSEYGDDHGSTFEAGERTYDFSMQIPMTALPPSFRDDRSYNCIRHELTAAMARPSWYKMDSRVTALIPYKPIVVPQYISCPLIVCKEKVDLHKERQGYIHKRESLVTMTLAIPEQIVANGGFPLNVWFDSVPYKGDEKQPLRVTDLQVSLKSKLFVTAKGRTKREPYQKLDIINKRFPSGTEGEAVDISRYLNSCAIGALVPSIGSRTMNLQWRVVVKAKVENCYRSKSERIKAKRPVQIINTGPYRTPFQVTSAPANLGAAPPHDDMYKGEKQSVGF